MKINLEKLKNIIRPIVKEVIEESLTKDGLLASIIQETAIGLAKAQVIVEEKKTNQSQKIRMEEQNRKNQEARKKLLDSIGSQRFNGVNVFENTKPMTVQENSRSPLANQDPNDAGVDITALPGMGNWSKLI